MCEIIFFLEFCWDICEFYAHILGSLHQGLEVDFFKIKSDKLRIATIQNTVNDEFDEVEGTGWRTYIARVANLATSDDV